MGQECIIYKKNEYIIQIMQSGDGLAKKRGIAL